MNEVKIGVLLLNLGTPDSPTTRDVRRYLQEFLSDRRVIVLPWIIRKILLYLFIFPFRSSKSAKAYQMIWDSNGSPLLYHTQNFGNKVQEYLGEKYHVEIGMRYGQPSIPRALDKMMENNCQKIIVLPLFPQYSSAATGSAIEKTLDTIKSKWNIPSLVVYDSFYNDASYINVQSDIIKPFLTNRPSEGVLLSYHSLPVQHIKQSSKHCPAACFENHPCPAISVNNATCYRAQCYETSRLLAQKLELSHEKYIVAFQSRLGRTQWIGPDIQSAMKILISRNVQDLIVACPSFVADCLETLEELGMRGKETWTSLGGKTFTLVPCLNADLRWVQTASEFIR